MAETEKARVDRELIELLNGLRVILPGVQVLLAFLLTVPFSSGFAKTVLSPRSSCVLPGRGSPLQKAWKSGSICTIQFSD